MSEWISIDDRFPELGKNVLVYARDVYYLENCNNNLSMYVGYFYDFNNRFMSKKISKKEIKFHIDCGCSGFERDTLDIDVLFWVDLPKPPEII